MSVYVEIVIRAPMDALWAHTQTPALHERWDLRFSRIEYLPKVPDTEPQRFRYTTRIAFGLEVSGEGETVGERDLTDGSRSSALKFGSSDALSIIRDGSGYWKYGPTTQGIRFLTRYDYQTRFGPPGALFDRFIFRPLIGWATAWSFDRLRLWLEERVEPELAMRQTLIHVIARVALVAVFAYQGVVPKLLHQHVDEITMLLDAGVSTGVAGTALYVLGILELAFAAVLLIAWHRRWPVFVCLGSMILATAAVGLNSPQYFAAAFNPAALNLAVACLAAIDLLVLGSIPSAARCRRRPSLEIV
ncbi:MAG TPA: DoxX-like family protein [Vicinamibacterales bacterium]|nr:DoxX-like family protein [Vicinamibacterales bacterium]